MGEKKNPFWIDHPFPLSLAYVEAFEPLVELKLQRFEDQYGTLLPFLVAHTPRFFDSLTMTPSQW